MDWKRGIVRGGAYSTLAALVLGSAWGISHFSPNLTGKETELREVTGIVKISKNPEYNFELRSSDGFYLFNTYSSEVFGKYKFPITATITTQIQIFFFVFIPI
ncbi:hypothetical protein CO038_02960 [Candidatus Pacearchaeota archaeon CG_4_9_14_0_2_um_filter_39_13]|nr:hypothetical protein [Candidatus Pacearchaeota archaeon]OIO42171.1 MAG: hypothetical protein AUJ64_04345 [Candidatus Pacearchaeota archaeon CG1_02_39_14]PJC44527.1 MAG: hypothetical protein CO038_02960 [Candidatus Pacearchaeota archaeon CG_4_9_14_0_2_um_filter_39_13]